MRLDPALQKLRRHAELRNVTRDGVEFEPAEPGGKDVFAQFGTQTATNTIPNIIGLGGNSHGAELPVSRRHANIGHRLRHRPLSKTLNQTHGRAATARAEGATSIISNLDDQDAGRASLQIGRRGSTGGGENADAGTSRRSETRAPMQETGSPICRSIATASFPMAAPHQKPLNQEADKHPPAPRGDVTAFSLMVGGLSRRRLYSRRRSTVARH